MNIQFTARRFHASDAMKESVIARAQDLTRYYENITSAHVILDAEDEIRKKAEVVLNTKRKSITGKAENEKMGAAIDAAFDKVETQLKKVNQKIKEHKQEGLKRSMRPGKEE
jgi:putative sigma-54 modulation protein